MWWAMVGVQGPPWPKVSEGDSPKPAPRWGWERFFVQRFGFLGGSISGQGMRRATSGLFSPFQVVFTHYHKGRDAVDGVFLG